MMERIFQDGRVNLGKESIQTEIEKAIMEVTGEEVDLTAAGRTDAGVHALGQTANFHTNTTIETSKIPYALIHRPLSQYSATNIGSIFVHTVSSYHISELPGKSFQNQESKVDMKRN